MQKFFQDLQAKLWVFIVEKFDKATEFSNEIWINTKPYIKLASQWASQAYLKISIFTKNLYSYIETATAFIVDKISKIKPFFERLYAHNKYEALVLLFFVLVILFFWIWMIIHVKRNEIFHKKLWMVVVIILGPIGAVIYYFLRKRKLEKEQDRQDKVMMGFFTPMHQNNEKPRRII